MNVNKEDIEKLIEKCFAELKSASQEVFDTDRATKVAALCIYAHGLLASVIADIEKNARCSKTNIQSVEAERHFDIKTAATGKITDAAMEKLLAKDAGVKEAKRANNEAEAELSKYKYVMATLKESHMLFRSMGKKGMYE